jgi:hypothetical protein
VLASHAVLEHRDRLVGRIVDDHQTFERAAASDPVEHKVRRPDLVRSSWAHQGLPLAHRDLLAPPPSHLQLLQRIEALDPFVV